MYKRIFSGWRKTNGKQLASASWLSLPAAAHDKILAHVAHLPALPDMPRASRLAQASKYWNTVIVSAMLVCRDWWSSIIVLIPSNEPEALLDYATEAYFRLHLDSQIYAISQNSMPLYSRISMKMKRPIRRNHPTVVRRLSAYLIRCLDRKFTSCLATLLLWGASPDAKSEDGYSALYVAVERRSPAMVDLLISHDPVKYEEADGRSPLALAAMTYQIEVMYSLLASGASPYIEFTYGTKKYSLISWACLCSDWRMIKCLVEQGVNVANAKPDAQHPLVIAAAADNVLVVKALLETGVRCKELQKVMDANELECPPRVVSVLTGYQQWIAAPVPLESFE